MSNWLALDKRSLGLLRILFGLLLALDVLLRGLHFRAFYTSEGIIPLKVYLLTTSLEQRRWSLFYGNDTPLIVGLVLVLFFFAALALAAGYRTRLVGWICLILLLGVYRRNPIANNGGDAYIPLILMWCNFIPWGEAFSVDSNRELDEDKARYSALPGFFYLIQVGILYWFSAVLRTGPEWQVDFSALYYALHIDTLNTGLAPYLLLMGTDLLALITFLTIVLEMVGPVLLLVPNAASRTLGVLLIMAFHLGILVTLLIPIFALACTIAPLGLLPSAVWESKLGVRLEAFLRGLFERLRVRFPRLVAPPAREDSRAAAVSRKIYPWLTVPIMVLSLLHLNWGVRKPTERFFLSNLVKQFSLDQFWGMFSPSPVREMHWQSVRALTESGEEINLVTGKKYSTRLQDFRNSTTLPDYRWRVFLQNPAMSQRSYPQLYLNYVIKEWDREHPDNRVVAAQFVSQRRSNPPHFLLGEVSQLVLAEYHR